MQNHEIKVYAPKSFPAQGIDWATDVLGKVLRPAIGGAGPFEWYWFTMYTPLWKDEPPSDQGEQFRWPDDRARFLKVRYRTDDPSVLVRYVRAYAAAANCTFDHGVYDPAGDIETSRYCADEQPPGVRGERPELVHRLLYAASKVALHTLFFDGQRWRFEQSTDKNNLPTTSVFQSLIHLIGNATGH